MSSVPVKASTRPCASIIATCRTSRCASAASRRLSASGAAHAAAHQLEALVAVRRVHERLRGHGADAGLGPRDDRADREPVRLHRHAHLAGGGIARDDGERVRQRAGLAGDVGGLSDCQWRGRQEAQRRHRDQAHGARRCAAAVPLAPRLSPPASCRSLAAARVPNPESRVPIPVVCASHAHNMSYLGRRVHAVDRHRLHDPRAAGPGPHQLRQPGARPVGARRSGRSRSTSARRWRRSAPRCATTNPSQAG